MDDNKPGKSWDNMCDVLVISIVTLRKGLEKSNVFKIDV